MARDFQLDKKPDFDCPTQYILTCGWVYCECGRGSHHTELVESYTGVHTFIRLTSPEYPQI